MTERRIVNLDVNDSGSWRRVTTFDIDWFEDGELESAVERLLELSSNAKLKARIIIPGDTAPLVSWDRDSGWQKWGRPA